MGSTTVSVPGPSAEERSLQAQQAALLKQQSQIIAGQQEQQQVLLPFFAQQAGIQLQYDNNGKITGASKINDPLELQSKEIQGKLNQRTLDALAGNLPVDPALERDLATKEQTLRERLQAQYGPGYESSTPAIQTLDQFFQSSESLRYGARTGQLTLAEQLGLARTESNMATEAQNLNIFRGFGVSDPLSIASATGSNAQGYGQAQVPFIQQRQMQLQASMANSQNQMQMMSGFGQLAGMALGAVFPMSDARLKSDLEWISDGPVPIFAYTIFGERHIGVMAQDLIKVRPDLVGEFAGYMTVNYKGL